MGLNRLYEDGVTLSDFAHIEKLLISMNSYGDLNTIFSDGTRLFVYHDARGYNGLHYTYRTAPFHDVVLKDEDLSISLSGSKPFNERGFIFASKPLTEGETWTQMERGKLMVISCGRQVYPETEACS